MVGLATELAVWVADAMAAEAGAPAAFAPPPDEAEEVALLLVPLVPASPVPMAAAAGAAVGAEPGEAAVAAGVAGGEPVDEAVGEAVGEAAVGAGGSAT